MGNGIIICNRVGGGAKWPMVAHIRFNREVHLYCHMPDAQLAPIRPMGGVRPRWMRDVGIGVARAG